MTSSFRKKRSGGPKTAAGKAVASRNSLKTGVYTSTLIIPGEDQAEFQMLMDSLSSELGIRGILESTLLHEIAAIAWKKLRLQGLEARSITEALSRPETPEEFYEAGFPKGEGSDWALVNLEAITEKCIEESRQRLDQPKLSKEILVKRRDQKLQAEEVRRLREEWIERKAQEMIKTGRMSITVARMLAEDELGPEESSDTADKSLDYIRMLLDEEERRQAQGAIFVGERLAEAQRLKDIIRDRRLASILEPNRFQRGHDDLSRAFSKAMKELRTQQEWRRKHEVIDVTPNEPEEG